MKRLASHAACPQRELGAHAMVGMAGVRDALTAAAYTIVVVSPIGLMFGVLWARTRNLLLLILLHGWTDLLPNLAPFIKTWWSCVQALRCNTETV